jgi:hypothetical protein
LSILEKLRDLLPANFFSDTRVKDLNCTVTDHATNRNDAISIASGSVVKAMQKP